MRGEGLLRRRSLGEESTKGGAEEDWWYCLRAVRWLFSEGFLGLSQCCGSQLEMRTSSIMFLRSKVQQSDTGMFQGEQRRTHGLLPPFWRCCSHVPFGYLNNCLSGVLTSIIARGAPYVIGTAIF